MVPPRSVTATYMARNLSDLLNQVRYQGVTLEVKRGAEVIARVTPARATQGFEIARLDELLSSLVDLDHDEKAQFLADTHAGDSQLTDGQDAWGS